MSKISMLQQLQQIDHLLTGLETSDPETIATINNIRTPICALIQEMIDPQNASEPAQAEATRYGFKLIEKLRDRIDALVISLDDFGQRDTWPSGEPVEN